VNIDDIYELILFILNKSQSGGYLSPDEFNRVFPAAQRGYCAYLLGTMQQYQPGRPVARVELGQNSVVRQRLTPVIYGYNLNVDTTGFSPYPGDYLQTDAMWSIYGYQRIRYADQQKLSSIYGSEIDPIISNPIYILEYDGFRFFPQSTTSARLNYVRNPPDPVWGYDEDVNGLPVYNPLKSTQCMFDDAAIMGIIVRALSMIGVNLQMPVVLQYAAEIKNNGQ
jgi:hypothetical protein